MARETKRKPYQVPSWHQPSSGGSTLNASPVGIALSAAKTKNGPRCPMGVQKHVSTQSCDGYRRRVIVITPISSEVAGRNEASTIPYCGNSRRTSFHPAARVPPISEDTISTSPLKAPIRGHRDHLDTRYRGELQQPELIRPHIWPEGNRMSFAFRYTLGNVSFHLRGLKAKYKARDSRTPHDRNIQRKRVGP